MTHIRESMSRVVPPLRVQIRALAPFVPARNGLEMRNELGI